MGNYVCTFTGHRPQHLPFGFLEYDPRCIALKKVLRSEITRLIEQGVTHFISGMAIGVDMYAAEIVIGLKNVYSNITLEGVLPCKSQAQKWSKSLQQRHAEILFQCDKHTCLQESYTPDCMQKRNQYIVNQADVILAVWDGRGGGTANTVKYALSQNKPVRVIHPQTLLVENV